MKTLLSISLFLLFSLYSYADVNVYFAHFIDKRGMETLFDNPESFLSKRSIDRRTKFGIEIDYSDLPNSPVYLDSIALIGVERIVSIKWLQGALIYLDESKVSQISDLRFVDSLEYLNILNPKQSLSVTKKVETKDNGHNQDALNQIEQIGLKSVHKKGYTGNGIHISVIDAGYLMVNQMDCFGHLRSESKILSTKDIVNPNSNIYSEHVHGTYVLSTMAAMVNDEIFGTAPDASYHLIRSEQFDYETPSEMYYWCKAAEYADSVGSDIINSSLGYYGFDDETMNLGYSDLDGVTSPCSRAANMAVEKGILVVASAGNEGNNDWRKITVPADAAKVLAVGAVDFLGNHSDFSSQGNSYDGRIKPDVVARGEYAAVIRTDNRIGHSNGTSFSSPIVAGMLACIIQAVPCSNPENILSAFRETSSKYANPDSLYGYGIPNAEEIIRYLKQTANVSSSSSDNWELKVNPVEDSFSIVNQKSPLKYRLYSGASALCQMGTIEIGEEAHLCDLEQGMYILLLNNTEKQQHIKMIIARD